MLSSVVVVGKIAGSAVQKVLGYTGDEARLLHMFKAPYSSPLVLLSYLQILFQKLVCIELALDQNT